MNALLFAALLQAAPAAPPPPETGRDIVVTGRTFKDTERAWRECIARKCPPDQEIAAALAHAENLFVAGDYRTARNTLNTTIGHVDRYAKDYPTQVAGIWRAEGRIAAHLGEGDAMRSGGFQAVDALRAGLPKDDVQIFGQRIEIADNFLKLGKLEMARAAYNDIASEAKAANRVMAYGVALMRLAILETSLAQIRPTVFRDSSRRAVKRVLDTREPELQVFREGAELLRARAEASAGDTSALERIVAATKPTARPALLFAPLRDGRGTILDPDAPPTQLTDADVEGQWVDITFLIGADGKVQDPEILRSGAKLRDDWTKPVITAIAGRRYAPLALPAGIPGVRRVERYTLTAFKQDQTGTRIGGRGTPRVEMMDLTAEPDAKSGD